jgi:hypothetical protein
MITANSATEGLKLYLVGLIYGPGNVDQTNEAGKKTSGTEVLTCE